MKRKIIFLLSAFAASVSLSAGTLFVNDPYQDEFAKMSQYMNSLIDSHMNASAITNYNYPRTNIQDKKDKIIIEFDLAGIEKKNISLSIDDQNILKLQGKKEQKVEEKDDKGEYVRREIYYGSFEKMIQLPKNIMQEKLSTKYNNGILGITIPKKEMKKQEVKVIPIN